MKVISTVIFLLSGFGAGAQVSPMIGIYPLFSNNISRLPVEAYVKNNPQRIDNVNENRIKQGYNSYGGAIGIFLSLKKRFVITIQEEFRVHNYNGSIEYISYVPSFLASQVKEEINAYEAFANVGIGRSYTIEENERIKIMPSFGAYFSHITYDRTITHKHQFYDSEEFSFQGVSEVGANVNLNLNARLTKRIGVSLFFRNLARFGYSTQNPEGNTYSSNGVEHTQAETSKFIYDIGSLSNTRIGAVYYFGKMPN